MLLTILMRNNPKFEKLMVEKGLAKGDFKDVSMISLAELKAMSTEIPLRGSEAKKRKWRRRVGVYFIITPVSTQSRT